MILEEGKMKRPTEEELIKYNVNYKRDTDFAAHARLLQSKWRVQKKLEMNNEIRSNYGNFIETESAKKKKSNYITENIKTLVVEKVNEIKNKVVLSVNREYGTIFYPLNLCVLTFLVNCIII
jgi:hypothetical protein